MHVHARYLSRAVDGGGRFAEGSDWRDDGAVELGEHGEHGNVRLQALAESARAEGRAGVLVGEPRRYHGKCRRCKLPRTGLVVERVQVRQEHRYGRSRAYVWRDPFLVAEGEGLEVGEVGVVGVCRGDCGGRVYLKPLQGSYAPEVPCDRRCTGARGSNCDCSCGGANHGADWA